MDERFRRIYKSIYEERTGLGPGYGDPYTESAFERNRSCLESISTNMIREAIDAVQRDEGIRLREGR
jgi:hypothetical protein